MQFLIDPLNLPAIDPIPFSDSSITYPITTSFSTVQLEIVTIFCADAFPPINPEPSVLVPATIVTLSMETVSGTPVENVPSGP